MKTFDRYSYLKYSTAAPMNAYKDTQHPPGQVVNQDKGQETLSDYIRSIQRAEALDDVAAEKKLTFEGWFFKEVGISLEGAKQRGVWDLALLEKCWNVALKHGKVS